LKRIVLISIAVVALIGAIGAFFWINKADERLAHPLEAVPTTADLILEFTDLRTALGPMTEVPYLQLIHGSSYLSGPLKRSVLLDSLFRTNELLQEATILHSVHSTQIDSSIGLLTIIHPKNAPSNDDLEEGMARLLQDNGFLKEQQGSTSRYVNADLGLSVAVSYGLILAADSPKLLTASLEALEGGRSLHADKQLQTARASAGKNVQMNLYLHLPCDAFRTSSLWNELGTWIALDVSTRAEGPVMNGFTYTSDTVPSLLALFKDQAPQQLSFHEVIPSQVASFLMFGASDMRKLLQDHDGLLASRGTTATQDTVLAAINRQIGANVSDHFLPWMGGQFGSCVLSGASGKGTGRTFGVFQSNDSELADKLLGELASKSGSDTALVRELRLNGLLPALFGSAFKDVESTYFTRHNDYIIFGATAEAVQGYVTQLKADRTLSKDVAFATFLNQFSSTFNVFSYQRLPSSEALLRSQLSGSGIALLEDMSGLFGQLPAFGAQFSSTGDAFYTNMHWQYDPEWEDRATSGSIAQLDAEVLGRPIWMRNHISKEPEILVQDADNTLYLFNQTGQELFRRKLAGPLLGEPKQVDPDKDGNLHYILGTATHLYLIDRTGKDASGFPVELESPAVAPVLVIDYDGKREYRLLIACKNRKVLNIGIDGKPVKGWKFDRTGDPLATAFAHLSIKSKDHIAALESDGSLHVLERTGAKRFKVKDKVKPSANVQLQPFRSKAQKHDGFYLTDTDGMVHQIGMDGKLKQHDLGKHSPDHRFLATDLNNDGEPELILSDLNTLKVFNMNRKQIFEQRVAPEALGPFLVEYAKNLWGIGYAFSEDGQVMLFDHRGEQVNGFPLDGTAPFDMTNLSTGERLAVVGNGKTLTILTLE
jgi:hypothetical protein